MIIEEFNLALARLIGADPNHLVGIDIHARVAEYPIIQLTTLFVDDNGDPVLKDGWVQHVAQRYKLVPIEEAPAGGSNNATTPVFDTWDGDPRHIPTRNKGATA